MSTTLVLQSHREPLPLPWLQRCLDSVEGWALGNGYDYRFSGDEIFDHLAPELRSKVESQIVIASDLARLITLQQGLAGGYDCVVWCDADFLIFDSSSFVLPSSGFALGREVWVQSDRERLRSFVKVHNAFLMFRSGDSFLDFYRDAAERLLRLNRGSMPPQFIGPKLLTALHNIVQCPVMEGAAMLSPMVLRDRLAGHGEALDLFRKKSLAPAAGANLSSSLTERNGLSDSDMNCVIDVLLEEGL